MSDDGVREHHGVTATAKGAPVAVTIQETDDSIFIDHSLESRRLSPEQARYLAFKLLRLARRVKARNP